jgi:hypothetical protein
MGALCGSMNDRIDNPMDVWLFDGSSGIMALSVDRDGERLPGKHGPWARIRALTLEHADEAEARALIWQHGFCCFDASPSDAEAAYPMRS